MISVFEHQESILLRVRVVRDGDMRQALLVTEANSSRANLLLISHASIVFLR